MLKSVAALLGDAVSPFELAILCEVFGIDRTSDGVPAFDFVVCGEVAGRPVPTATGMAVVPASDYSAATEADLVAIPAGTFNPSEALVAAIRAAHDRGAYVLSLCSGAFTLAAAGILAGRRCSTHWRHADQLAAQYPDVIMDPDVLYSLDGNVLTSAGTAAGIDACLFLVRRELGAAVANRIARRMVVPPHREGGQRQFIETPIPTPAQGVSLNNVLPQLQLEIAEPHTVASMAQRAGLSERTFARHFTAATGMTPLGWLTQQRLLVAKELLEESDLSMESVAHQVGWGSAALLRHHFTRAVGISPADYRKAFRSR